MDLALVFSALMLGLAGAPHCAAMCGAACSAATRGGAGAPTAFHITRVAGYAVAGAVAASSVGVLSALGQFSPALRPLWTLAHAAALGLGLWLMWQGRQPAWMESLGRGGTRQSVPDAQGWQRMKGPVRAGAAGTLWVAWPCGLLQSALVVAALANHAGSGAAVMAAFGITSAAGLTLGPWLWLRLGGAGAAALAGTWATRGAGALLAGVSGWALGHDLVPRIIAYCTT